MIIGMKWKGNLLVLPGYCSAVYVGISALQAPTVILTRKTKKSLNLHGKFFEIFHSLIIAKEIVSHKLSARAKLIKTQAAPAMIR